MLRRGEHRKSKAEKWATWPGCKVLQFWTASLAYRGSQIAFGWLHKLLSRSLASTFASTCQCCCVFWFRVQNPLGTAASNTIYILVRPASVVLGFVRIQSQAQWRHDSLLQSFTQPIHSWIEKSIALNQEVTRKDFLLLALPRSVDRDLQERNIVEEVPMNARHAPQTSRCFSVCPRIYGNHFNILHNKSMHFDKSDKSDNDLARSQWSFSDPWEIQVIIPGDPSTLLGVAMAAHGPAIWGLRALRRSEKQKSSSPSVTCREGLWM